MLDRKTASASIDGGLTRAEAARELLTRDRAVASLTDFSQAVVIPGAPMPDDPDGWLFKPIESAVALHHVVIMRAIESCIRADYGRLMIFAPPGSAKSTYAAAVATTWAMGAFPGIRVLMTSYAAAAIERHSKRARQIVASADYTSIWEQRTHLVDGSKAANEWELTNGSGMFAAGLKGGITSTRCDLGIIDDPVAGRQEADSETERAAIRQAYEDDFLTRLKPKASVILIQCMVGDTQVLMADGSQKSLKDILVGDAIATYIDGKLSTSTVLNWANNGSDRVYEIRMSSGISVRANERHPFLVDRGGKQWVRLRELKVGDCILRAIGASGEVLCARTEDACVQPSARDIACPTTTNICGQAGTGRLQLPQRSADPRTYGIDTASMLLNTMQFSQSKTDFAPSANNSLDETFAPIGAKNSASIMTTSPERSAASCAMTATSRSGMGKQQPGLSLPLSTYEIIPDCIVAILEYGCEDVFDIQVAETENFIANGLISHNTRWHQEDLAGSILPEDYDGRSGPVECRDGQTWHILNLPAQCERTDDPAGRAIGDYLWPEWFTDNHWRIFQRNARTWNSLYQQRPTAHEGIYFKRADFKRFELSALPQNLRFYLASDWAVTEKQVGGDKKEPDFTEHGIFGANDAGDVYAVEGYGKQAVTDETIPEALNLIRRRKPALWLGEKGVIENAIGGQVRAGMRQAQRDGKPAWCARELLPSVGDKVAKSSAFAGMVSAGVVYVANTAWGDALIEQLCAFPGGRFDDKVDMCGMIGRALDMLWGKRETAPAVVPQNVKPFTRAHLEAQTVEDEDRQRMREGYYR